jgi:8-oxo-dGTP pyrophosphatase MutT (NUDIX family)
MGIVRDEREVSAGGVAYRRTEGRVDIALASRRTGTGQLVWGLPKGHIDDGESPRETAVRETREETGLVAEIEADLGEISYRYVRAGARISKVVHFFLMRVTGGSTAEHDREMEQVRWFPLAEALSEAAYDGERDVLRRAEELLK